MEYGTDPIRQDMRDFAFVQGNPATALAEPYTLVLTETTARKYFGEEDPIGQTLWLREPSDRDEFAYMVTGILADPPPTHLPLGVLASYVTQRGSRSENWLGFGVYTYIRLRPGADPKAVRTRLGALFTREAAAQLRELTGRSPETFEAAGNHVRYSLQPLTDIHLHSQRDGEIQPHGNATLVRVLACVALLILLAVFGTLVAAGLLTGILKTLRGDSGQ